MPEHVLLTDQRIRSFKTPSAGTTTFWDKSTRGFGVRVSAGGTKSFIVLIAEGRRKSLGKYPSVTLSAARTEAKRLLAEKALGKIRPKHKAFDDAKAEFLEEKARHRRPRTVGNYKQLLNRHFRFGRKSIGDITPYEISRVLNRLNDTPALKHHAYTAAQVLFNWARDNQLIEVSPFDRIRVENPKSTKDRSLHPKEVRKLLEKVADVSVPFHAIIALCLLTGQRRSEIAALEWTWIDFDQKTITFPPTLTKNHREHCFPIGSRSLQVLEQQKHRSPYVFPAASVRSEKTTTFAGWSKGKRKLDRALKLAPWTIHDLRRTLRTLWAELGVPIEVAERYINHVSGVHSGVQGIYNRYKYLPEMRAAVEKWEDFLQSLAGQP